MAKIVKKDFKKNKPIAKRLRADQVGDINYKNADVLKRYLSPRFKIMPKKSTGLSSKDQRKLKNEVKKARFMGLIPFTDRHTLS